MYTCPLFGVNPPKRPDNWKRTSVDKTKLVGKKFISLSELKASASEGGREVKKIWPKHKSKKHKAWFIGKEVLILPIVAAASLIPGPNVAILLSPTGRSFLKGFFRNRPTTAATPASPEASHPSPAPDQPSGAESPDESPDRPSQPPRPPSLG